MFCLLSVFLHALLISGFGFLKALYNVAGNISKIMSVATMLTIFEEGIDIMFQRIRDTLKKERDIKAESKAEGKAEAYREMAEWNSRRLAAEARGEKFTEPPPGAPLNR